VWGGGCELQRGSVSVPVDRPVSGSGPEGTLLDLEPLRRNERQCLLLLYKCPDQGSQTGMHAEHKSLDFRLLSSGAGGRRGQWMGLRLGGVRFRSSRAWPSERLMSVFCVPSGAEPLPVW